MRDWVTNLSTTHYLVGSAIGPHPFPTIVRDYQRVIGREIKSQMAEVRGKLPDAVVACVGGGSNAIGTFYDFIKEAQTSWARYGRRITKDNNLESTSEAKERADRYSDTKKDGSRMNSRKHAVTIPTSLYAHIINSLSM